MPVSFRTWFGEQILDHDLTVTALAHALDVFDSAEISGATFYPSHRIEILRPLGQNPLEVGAAQVGVFAERAADAKARAEAEERAKKSAAERKAHDTPPEKRTSRDWEMAYQVEEKLKVTYEQLARAIKGPNARTALQFAE